MPRHIPDDIPEFTPIKESKIPKTPSTVVDMLYLTREARLKADKFAAALKKQETMLKQHLIDNVSARDQIGAMGVVAQATIKIKSRWQLNDWDKFLAFCVKKKAFHLMQHRLSDGAVTEAMDAGVKVPGVEGFQYKDISLTKV